MNTNRIERVIQLAIAEGYIESAREAEGELAEVKRRVSDLDLRSGEFAFLVRQELTEARDTHTKAINSHHEAYSVILEELEEYWQEVRSKASDRRPARMLAELVQIGAMCQRAAEDLHLAERASL